MKKILLYSFFVGAALLIFNACSLDETPTDKLPENEASASAKLIYLNFVAGLYNNVGGDGDGRGIAGTDRGLYDMNVLAGDEMVLPTRGSDWYDGGLWQEFFKHEWRPTNQLVSQSWTYLYGAIGQCNFSLDRLQVFANEDPSNTFLPIYIAEVRALRALFYYYLLDNFARVPVVTSTTTLIKDVRQSQRSEVYKFVKDELQTTLPLLASEKSASTGAYYGRMTKSVAYFLLAKLAINAQVYADDNWVDNNGVPNGATDFTIGGTNLGAWKATIAYCDSITNQGYSLNSGYALNFSVRNEGSPENIFVIPMDPAIYKARNMYLVRTRHYAHGKAFGLDGWNGASATKELLAIFRKDAVDPRLNMSFYMGKVTGPDGRFIKDGAIDLEYKPDAIRLVTTNLTEEKTAGARWAKYETDRSALDAGKQVNNDFVLYRYADVLLMKAEALVRDGRSAEANAPLAQVRNRVSAAVRTASLDNILDERMLELSWEGFRRQDLIRFNKFNNAITDRAKSDAYRKVFPIPSAEIQSNPNLTQNEGYPK